MKICSFTISQLLGQRLYTRIFFIAFRFQVIDIFLLQNKVTWFIAVCLKPYKNVDTVSKAVQNRLICFVFVFWAVLESGAACEWGSIVYCIAYSSGSEAEISHIRI
jgi:hypothetical protein